MVPFEGMSELRRRLETLQSELAIDIALQLAGMPIEAAENVQTALLSWLQGKAAALNSEQHSALDALRLSRHVPQPWRDRLTHLLSEQYLSLQHPYIIFSTCRATLLSRLCGGLCTASSV